MTKKERRINILKDAIKQIKAQKIIADEGTVVYMPSEIHQYEEDLKPKLVKYFSDKKTEQAPCYACARGSLLLATIHKENDFTLTQLNMCGGGFRKGSATDSRLLRLFSAQQIALMENAFEINDLDIDYETGEYYGMNSDVLPKKLNKASIEFGQKYENAEKRLLAIFTNAVKNGGIFKP